jgi:hypothetical protein
MKNKYKCSNCPWQGEGLDLLVAPNPFDLDDDIVGCPKCKGINTMQTVCQEDNCWEIASSGVPFKNGDYKWLCHKHAYVSKDEK